MGLQAEPCVFNIIPAGKQKERSVKAFTPPTPSQFPYKHSSPLFHLFFIPSHPHRIRLRLPPSFTPPRKAGFIVQLFDIESDIWYVSSCMLGGLRRRLASRIRRRGVSDGPQKSLCVRQFQVSRHSRQWKTRRIALINFHSAERRFSSWKHWSREWATKCTWWRWTRRANRARWRFKATRWRILRNRLVRKETIFNYDCGLRCLPLLCCFEAIWLNFL